MTFLSSMMPGQPSTSRETSTLKSKAILPSYFLTEIKYVSKMSSLYFGRYERLKAEQVRREKALADIWNTPITKYVNISSRCTN